MTGMLTDYNYTRSEQFILNSVYGIQLRSLRVTNVTEAPVAPTNIITLPTSPQILESAAKGSLVAILFPIDGDAVDAFRYELTDQTPSAVLELQGRNVIIKNPATGLIGQNVEFDITVFDSYGFSFKKSFSYPVVASISFNNLLSFKFDGVHKNIDLGGDASLKFEENLAFSVSFWAIFDNTGGAQPFVSNFDNNDSDKGWQVEKLGTNRRIRFTLEGPGSDRIRHDGTTQLTTAIWYHIVCTYDGLGVVAGTNIYLDGVLETTFGSTDNLSGSSIVGNGRMYLGSKPQLNQFFEGNMDEISFWDKELSLAEVGALRTGSVPADLSAVAFESNLVSWYRGDNDIYPIATDNKGSNDGVMNNMTAADLDPVVP